MSYLAALILYSMGYSATAAAQLNYQFENLTEANGLSDNRVTCFFKDKTGYMWIGTENGLNRYDGNSFFIYNTGLKKYNLSNPFVNDIEQDASGKLWVATQSGLNIIDTKKDSTTIFISEYSKNTSRSKNLPNNLIWDTFIGKDGKIWLAADVKDLCYYDTSHKTFHFFPWRKYIRENFPARINKYNSIRKIYYKSETELWLGTSAGLFSFNTSTTVFTHYPSFEADHFILLEEMRNKNVYFLQEPANDVQVLHQGSRYSVIPVVERQAATDQQLIIPADTGDLLWLPAGRNLLQVNSTTDETRLITHIANNVYSLPAGNMRTIYRDNLGMIWVASDNGIGKFNPAMNFFPFIPVTSATQPTAPEHDLFRVKHNVHSVFYSREDEKYYVSSPRFNCLYIIDRKTGKKEIITKVLGIPLQNCSVIYEDRYGMLWILAGTHAFQYNRKTKKFSLSAFVAQKKNLLFADMAEDNNGNIWFACWNDGLYRYNTQTHAVWKPSAKDEFSSTLPTSLLFDKEKNRLWVGTFDYGLYEFNYLKKSGGSFNRDIMKAGYINASLIMDVLKDKFGKTWVATYADGISIFSDTLHSTRLTKKISIADGLPENNVYALAMDLKGNVWATTFRGISGFTADGKLVKNYNRGMGLPFTDLYSPVTVTPGGQLLTGVENGFIAFHPDNLKYAPPPYQIVITSFLCKRKDSLSVVDTSSSLVFTHNNNEVQFNFAALNFNFSSQTKYSYLLQGQDKHRVITTQNSVRYNNLAPGPYTFNIRAIDFTGTLSENEAAISFRILPPWWQTWWFRLLAGISIVSALLLVLRVRIKNIRTKAAVRQQIAELKSQALRAQMNPHFIFNSLNAIQELIITENYTASYQYLSKFSKLLRMVLNMSEKNLIALSNEIEMCSLYLELESLRFKHSFHYTIDTGKIDTDTTLFPTLLVQPFIENAIWHGLMQKDGEKTVAVRFAEKEGMMTCTVKDNGIGMEKAAIIKSKKLGSAHFGSKGIELAMQRIAALKAGGLSHATISILNCVDETGNATGTEVVISISSPANPLL